MKKGRMPRQPDGIENLGDRRLLGDRGDETQLGSRLHAIIAPLTT